MEYKELLNRAMGPDGLSANFLGKKETIMSSVVFQKKTFRMTVKNDTAEDLTFALVKGTFPDLGEIKKKYADVKAILADGDFFTVGEGDAAKKASCKVSGKTSVKHLQEFFAHGFEGEITNLEMISNEKGNFQEEIQAVIPSPFEAMPADSVALSQCLEPSQYDQNRVIAENIRVPLSPLALVTFTVLANSYVTYVLTINSWSR